MASWFDKVETAPPIEVFALTQAFNEDSNPDKVNLSVGGEYTLCRSFKTLESRTRSICFQSADFEIEDLYQ